MDEGPSVPEQPVSRRIVCAYDIELLPTWWLQVHRIARARLERERALARVDLLPLTALPDVVDLLLVPPDALPGAREYAPDVECVAITSDDYPRQVVEILGHLRSRGWYAVQESTEDAPPQPKIVRLMGYEKID